MPFTCVHYRIRPYAVPVVGGIVWQEGEPDASCGRSHPTGVEANECSWRHESGETTAVLDLADWDHDRHADCGHGLHPEECARCVWVRAQLLPCPHLGDPWTCVRCALLDHLGITTSYEECTEA